MAVIGNTVNTYDVKGIREDLSDIISNIAPTETPFQSMIGRSKSSQPFFEWQQDSLSAAATTGAVVEGDDVAAFDAITPTSRIGNYNQINRKTIVVSGTNEATDKAGRKSELAYQLTKKSKELKRDIEATMLSNQPAVSGGTAVARKTAAMLAWIRSNTDKGATGADPAAPNPTPAAGRTDGTARAFTETILKSVIQKVWVAGGSPSVLMVDGVQKQTVSGFAGLAQTRLAVKQGQEQGVIIGAADVYVSDFGEVTVVPNRFQRHSDGFVLDPSMVKMNILRPYKVEDLAKTGDAEKKMLLVEWGLRVVNEAGLGLCADLL